MSIEKAIVSLEKARTLLTKQKQVLDRLTEKSYIYAIVLGEDKRSPFKPGGELDTDEKKGIKTWRVTYNSSVYEVLDNPSLQIKTGCTVKCIATDSSIAIMEVTAEPISLSRTATVKSVLDEGHVEVEMNGTSKVVLSGLFPKLEEGSTVVLDETERIVMASLGKRDIKYVFNKSTGVSWEDIGGLEDAKKEIIDAIENPIKYAKIYTAYGKKPTKGLLLWGPPGNGKTMFGKAVATAVSKINGGEESGFIYVKGPEILSMYVGTAEERIRGIFATAAEFKKRTGNPAVVFIDEAEAILGKRGSGVSSDIDKTIVPQFLTEMDGLDGSKAIVLLATNRPDIIDSAVLREGRIDKKIRIGKPDKKTMDTILRLNLKKVPLIDSADKIIERAISVITDKKLALYEIKHTSGTTMFGFGDIISGAMLATIVNNSIAIAIDRDLAAGKDKPEGIKADDIEKAATEMFRQNARMNHKDHLDDFAYEMTQNNEKVLEIKPCKIN